MQLLRVKVRSRDNLTDIDGIMLSDNNCRFINIWRSVSDDTQIDDIKINIIGF